MPVARARSPRRSARRWARSRARRRAGTGARTSASGMRSSVVDARLRPAPRRGSRARTSGSRRPRDPLGEGQVGAAPRTLGRVLERVHARLVAEEHAEAPARRPAGGGSPPAALALVRGLEPAAASCRGRRCSPSRGTSSGAGPSAASVDHPLELAVHRAVGVADPRRPPMPAGTSCRTPRRCSAIASASATSSSSAAYVPGTGSPWMSR